MKKSVYLLILSVCIISCERNEDKKTETSLIHLKIEKMDISLRLSPLRLSEFVDSIGYLQLETTNECFLPYDGVRYTLYVDNFLFLGDLHAILKFDAITGKFLGKIGSRGQGPGEYTQIQNICIDKDNNKIIVKERSKKNLTMYNYEGKYLEKINLDDMEETKLTTCYYSLSLEDIDSQYMTFTADIMPVEYACQSNEIIIYDYRNKKIIHRLPNLMNGTYERYSNRMNGMRAGTRYGDNFYHKSFYNDTLYTINKDIGIKPYAIINLGDRKLPNEVFFSKDGLLKIFGKILINSIFINQYCILFECYFPGESGYGDYFICKYDITHNKLTYHQPGIINDIDGGPNVRSIRQLSDKVEYIIPSDILNEKEKRSCFSTLDKSELKHPEYREKFEFIQKNRKIDDNPLLMMLYIK